MGVKKASQAQKGGLMPDIYEKFRRRLEELEGGRTTVDEVGKWIGEHFIPILRTDMPDPPDVEPVDEEDLPEPPKIMKHRESPRVTRSFFSCLELCRS